MYVFSMHMCMSVCMYPELLEITTNLLCVCAHLANEAQLKKKKCKKNCEHLHFRNVLWYLLKILLLYTIDEIILASCFMQYLHM